jgi:hypothetical protein
MKIGITRKKRPTILVRCACGMHLFRLRSEKSKCSHCGRTYDDFELFSLLTQHDLDKMTKKCGLKVSMSQLRASLVINSYERVNNKVSKIVNTEYETHIDDIYGEYLENTTLDFHKMLNVNIKHALDILGNNINLSQEEKDTSFSYVLAQIYNDIITHEFNCHINIKSYVNANTQLHIDLVAR